MDNFIIEDNQIPDDKKRKQFADYAKTLPGGEEISEYNPLVKIRIKADDSGNIIKEAVTVNKLLHEKHDEQLNEKGRSK